MSSDGSADVRASEAPISIYRTYDDGYRVRSMTAADAEFPHRWFSDFVTAPRFDLDIALQVFPASSRGFYIGELDGRVIASAIRIPWSGDVCYGSLYYVEKAYRGRGYGTRLRDEVALEHVGERKLCVDAIMGKVADTNRAKFCYKDAFKTGMFVCRAKPSYDVDKTVHQLTVENVAFEKIIDYDNRCFISSDFVPRRDFLRKWFQIPGGATYVAVSDVDGHVIGYGSRRPAIQTGKHLVGPLYADSREVAKALLGRLCSEVSGDDVMIDIWYVNDDANWLVKEFECENVMDLCHMHANGDPGKHNPQVYALSSDVGFCLRFLKRMDRQSAFNY